MPATLNGTATTIDIPYGTSGDQFITLINDRLRRLAEQVSTATIPSISADLDMNGFRILELGDPVDAQDAVNLRSVPITKTTQVTNTTIVQGKASAPAAPAPPAPNVYQGYATGLGL